MTNTSTYLSRVRDDLAVRRARREASKTLRRELASYTSPAEVDELLTMIGSRDDATAEEMRTILLRNRDTRRARPFAS